MKELMLKDFVNRKRLKSQRKDGLVLFDYGAEIQYEFDWDITSLNARGIIFDEATGKLVARAYPKFFNHEELVGDMGGRLPEGYQPNFEGEFMCLEKADGSLGIAYFYKNEWRVNTRGSFESEQAIWAKSYLDEYIRTELMNSSYTYLFEIIYPENRIVVDYGSLETLRLTGIIVTETGEELWVDKLQNEAEKIGCEVVKAFEFSSLEEMFEARKNLTVNEEGYVITYKNGYKFKLKGEMYCNVHRALCSLTPLSFWRVIDYESTMRIPQEFLELMPEEFRSTVDALCKVTEDLHINMYENICRLVATVPEFEQSREGNKQRYMWIKDNIPTECINDVLGVISANELSDGNDWKVRTNIHRRLRPTSNTFEGVKLEPRLKRILEGL